VLLKRSNAMKSIFELKSERLILAVLPPSSAESVVAYLLKNRSFHEPYHQLHDDSYFTPFIQKQYLRSDMNGFLERAQCGFWLIKIEEPGRVIGRLAFSGVIRGALQSCLMGYHLDQDEIGKGYMSEAIRTACAYIFSEWNLHRIQADIMPRNVRSIGTIERSGFKKQGQFENYMAINGKWEDHVTYALINNNYFNHEILR